MITESVISLADLKAFGASVRFAADAARKSDAPLVTSIKGCRWCKAKATCPAIREEAMADFETVDPATAEPDVLATVMSKIDLFDGWVKSLRAETERRLLAGVPVPGFKLVAGKRGARKWGDSAAAEQYLKKTVRLKVDQMYDFSLISPTSAEKLLKAEAISQRQWDTLQQHITQTTGGPSVAPESDKRPALTSSVSADDFADLTPSQTASTKE